jgi:hypothetical protein
MGFPFMGTDLRRSLKGFKTKIETDGNGVSITWHDSWDMACWFYEYVLAHELGHHFVEQYKTKNGPIRSRNAEEHVANLRGARIVSQVYAAIRRKRSAQKGSGTAK